MGWVVVSISKSKKAIHREIKRVNVCPTFCQAALTEGPGGTLIRGFAGLLPARVLAKLWSSVMVSPFFSAVTEQGRGFYLFAFLSLVS